MAFGAAMAVALSVGGAAWAFDDSALPAGRGAACSSLCRSWMAIGQAEIPETAPAEATAEVRPATARPEAPPAVKRSADRPRRTAGPRSAMRAVPKGASVSVAASRKAAPPLRDATKLAAVPQLSPIEAAAVPAPVDGAARPLPTVQPAASASARPSLEPPPVVVPAPLSVTGPSVPAAVSEASASEAVVRPPVPVAASPAEAAPAAPAVGLAAPRPLRPVSGTPLVVKLGVYVALASIGLVMFKPRRRRARTPRKAEPVLATAAAPQAVASRSGGGLRHRPGLLPPGAAAA